MKKQIRSALSISVGVVAVLGLVLVPAVANAANTTTVNAVVSSGISITTSGTVNLAITPTSAGSYTSASDTVTVGTNNALGYNLKIKGATTTLASGGNTLAAVSGTFASPSASMGVNQWGYRVDGLGTFGAGPTTAQTNQASLSGSWAGVTTADVQIKSTSSANASDTTTVFYGASADLSKPSGTYTNTITYTATNN